MKCRRQVRGFIDCVGDSSTESESRHRNAELAGESVGEYRSQKVRLDHTMVGGALFRLPRTVGIREVSPASQPIFNEERKSETTTADQSREKRREGGALGEPEYSIEFSGFKNISNRLKRSCEAQCLRFLVIPFPPRTGLVFFEARL